MNETITMTKQDLEEIVTKSVDAKVSVIKEEIARNKGFATNFSMITKENNPNLLGAYIRVLAESQKTNKDIKKVAENYRNTAKTTASDLVYKSLNETNAEDGGLFVLPEYSSEFIQLLTAESVVRQLGVTNISMKSDSLKINREDVGTQSAWEGEIVGAATKSAPKFGTYTLTPKKIFTWTTFSNDLLSDAGTNVEQLVQDQFISSASKLEDTAFFNGTGSDNQIKGIYNWLDSTAKINTTGTTTEQIEADLYTALLSINGTRVSSKLTWVMPYRTYSSLLTKLRVTTGQIAFPELRNPNPTLLGYPVKISNNISITQGSGSNKTQIFLINPIDFVIADRVGQEFRINPVQNDSNFQHGISETLIVAESRVDCMLKYSIGSAAAIYNVAY